MKLKNSDYENISLAVSTKVFEQRFHQLNEKSKSFGDFLYKTFIGDQDVEAQIAKLPQIWFKFDDEIRVSYEKINRHFSRYFPMSKNRPVPIIHNFERLQQHWPEGSEFYKHLEQVEPAAQHIVIRPDFINIELGLAVAS